MRSMVIGHGEVGSALYNILSKELGFLIGVLDIDGRSELHVAQADVLHICIPYSETFIEDVKAYQEQYKPKHTIIHSTVPVGTSTKLGAVNSPVRGIHPNLEEGIRTFVKFIGGPQAGEVADYFRKAGLKVQICEKSETTELMKLLDTEYYRACIEFTQRAKEMCDKFDVPFSEAYTLANMSYNEGYMKLDHPEYVRPVLQAIPGKIGGHCVGNNAVLLKMSVK